MKRIFNHINPAVYISLLAVTLVLGSCKKDSDGSPDVPAGDMSSGSINPNQAAGGAVITLTGSGIGDIRSIVFEKNNCPAPFLTTLNTETDLIFNVPDTAAVGNQNVIFTNSKGKTLIVPFKVLGLAKITGVSNYNFTTGTQLTLTGVNLDDVSKVVLKGSTTEAAIVSKTATQLVITMPATTLARMPLDITNLAGTATTSQEFVSLLNNFVVFTDAYGPGAYNAGVQNWSYGLNGLSEVTDVVKTGTKSLKVDYNDGGFSAFLGCTWADPNQTFAEFYPERKFLTFWARAVDADVAIRIQPDTPWSGTAADMWTVATASGNITVTVPKNTWTYFKIPATFITGNYSRLNFIISGSTSKVVYYDDIMWVK